MTSLGSVLESYLADLRVRAKRSSVRIAAVHVRTIDRHVGVMDAELVSRAFVNDLVLSLRADGLRDTSINGTLRILRAALRLAGLNSPVKLLKETRKIPAVLTEAQLVELIRATPSDQGRTAVYLAAYAGLRKGEIEHLTWADVTGVIRVSAKPGWTPKSHAEREIPTSVKLWEWLEAQRPVNRPGTSPVIWDRYAWSHVRIGFTAAGLGDPDLKPGLHMLRRTFASRLLQTGADIETVRELGGWADLATVQRYVASTTDLKRAAVERL